VAAHKELVQIWVAFALISLSDFQFGRIKIKCEYSLIDYYYHQFLYDYILLNVSLYFLNLLFLSHVEIVLP